MFSWIVASNAECYPWLLSLHELCKFLPWDLLLDILRCLGCPMLSRRPSLPFFLLSDTKVDAETRSSCRIGEELLSSSSRHHQGKLILLPWILLVECYTRRGKKERWTSRKRKLPFLILVLVRLEDCRYRWRTERPHSWLPQGKRRRFRICPSCQRGVWCASNWSRRQ